MFGVRKPESGIRRGKARPPSLRYSEIMGFKTVRPTLIYDGG